MAMCTNCGDQYSDRRLDLGYRTCLECGDDVARTAAEAASAPVVTLLPCPFCGGEGIVTQGNICDSWIACQKCGSEGPWRNTEAEAIAAWNTRTAAEAASAATVAELVEALQEQVDECFGDRCEMCLRHEAIIARAKATEQGEG